MCVVDFNIVGKLPVLFANSSDGLSAVSNSSSTFFSISLSRTSCRAPNVRLSCVSGTWNPLPLSPPEVPAPDEDDEAMVLVADSDDVIAVRFDDVDDDDAMSQ